MNARCGVTAPPAICIHDLSQARAVVAGATLLGRAVLLLSGRNAAAYAGCRFWHALITAATAEAPRHLWTDLLDCGDSAGHAMAALRVGVRGIILSPTNPALAAVQAAAHTLDAVVITERPACLDFERPDAARHLARWLCTP